MSVSRRKTARGIQRGPQSRLGSFVEASANIAIGFSINFMANWLILPAFGFHSLTPEKNFEIGLLYTVISLCRSYVIRRYFNGLRFFRATTNR